MLLDIVILPPVALRKRLGSIALRASKICKSACLVDNVNLISHCSLFHIRATPDKVPLLYKKVKQLTVSYSPIVVKSKGCHISEAVWVVIPLKVNNKLIKFRSDIINSCKILRTGMMPAWGHRNLTTQEKYWRRKYGVSYSPAVYKPHLTVGTFDPKCINLVYNYLHSKNFSFVANEVAICQINKYWQVTKILKKFKIK